MSARTEYGLSRPARERERERERERGGERRDSHGIVFKASVDNFGLKYLSSRFVETYDAKFRTRKRKKRFYFESAIAR